MFGKGFNLFNPAKNNQLVPYLQLDPRLTINVSDNYTVHNNEELQESDLFGILDEVSDFQVI